MRVLVRLSQAVTGRSGVYARAARFLSELAIYANRMLLRSDKTIPPLYRAGIRYQQEPLKTGDELVDIDIIRHRKWGDCFHLTAWRIAELREAGENAQPHYTWKLKKLNGKVYRLFHVQVRRGNGTIEDPSRRLGM